MITLMIIMMSPIVVPNLRLKKIASTSVPSITAPPLTDKPIPAPRKKPPKTATSKLSFVTSGNVTVARTRASPEIARMVLIAKALLIVLKARIIKGILIQMIKTHKGMEERTDIKSEIPVAPPSIKRFVSRETLETKCC